MVHNTLAAGWIPLRSSQGSRIVGVIPGWAGYILIRLGKANLVLIRKSSTHIVSLLGAGSAAPLTRGVPSVRFARPYD